MSDEVEILLEDLDRANQRAANAGTYDRIDRWKDWEIDGVDK